MPDILPEKSLSVRQRKTPAVSLNQLISCLDVRRSNIILSFNRKDANQTYVKSELFILHILKF